MTAHFSSAPTPSTHYPCRQGLVANSPGIQHHHLAPDVEWSLILNPRGQYQALN